jgi:hypothetical protein
VTALDAYAVVALLKREPTTGEVWDLLNTGEATLTRWAPGDTG